MDKKNTILGMICIGAGIGVMFWQARQMQERPEPAPAEIRETAEPSGDGGAGESDSTERADASSEESERMLDLLATEVGDESSETEVAPGETITLANEFIEVEFTTRGGAIRTVGFLQTKRGDRDDYVYNEGGLLPALSMSIASAGGGTREFDLNFEVVERSEHRIVFVLDAGDGLRIRRSYTLANGEGKDPYVITHATSFENRSDSAKALSTIYLNLGTARPIAANQLPNFLNVGTFDGEDTDFVAINKLTGSGGFLGIGASSAKDEIIETGRFEWVSVKNQFFASVLSSTSAAREVRMYPVYPEAVAVEDSVKTGITGSAGYAVETVPAGASQELAFEFYIGPKEFKRLQALGNEQDHVMQFGFLSFFSKLLLSLMYAIHAVVPSWGWSIVIMTIIIKLLFWPLTAKASRSQKRMSKIQGPMSELREKYKDNPQKMQQETLKLFREHQVNPVAGCLPMLVQMPIFLGLFYMLRTASELRHEPFLWISDLSQPDTIAELAGFPINLMPLIMGATMYLQMSMMPVSPTADPVQQKIFKFLPFIFLVFLYNFSSGLVVYWTVQNILTIIQQKIINSRPDEPLPAKAGDPAAAAKPVSGKVVTGKAKGRKKKK